MLEEVTQWLAGLGNNARQIIDTPQIILLVIILVGGWLLQFLVRRLLNSLAQRLSEAGWSSSLLAIARRLALPLTVLLLSALAIEMMAPLGWNVGQLQLTSELRYHIWDALAARDIEIPFPQRDIHIRSGVPWSSLTPPDSAST